MSIIILFLASHISFFYICRKTKQLHKGSFNFQNHLGDNIWVYKWMEDNTAPPKAIIQISHGMMEHADRYAPFAEFLTRRGFIVYANDHPGHGKSIKNDKELGHFNGKYGWEAAVDTLFDLSGFIKQAHPDVPLILAGHSMGSILARHYAIKYGKSINGLILSGTYFTPSFLTAFAKTLSSVSITIHTSFFRDKLLFKLVVSDLNKKFRPGRTGFEWLNSDPKEVDKYMNNPLCGYQPTAGFYKGMFYGIGTVNNPTEIKKMPSDLPVYMFAGKNDPVGNFGKGVEKVYQLFKTSGMNNLSIKLYKDGRHEMLKEINKDEVMEDVVEWINLQLAVGNWQ